MANARLPQLTTALRDRTLIRFTRPYYDDIVNGYVLDIGPQWLVLAFVSDGIHFNGFRCFKLADIRKLKVPDPYTPFVEAALRKRRLRIPKKPRISVASIDDLLLSANRAFPLITIHREKLDSDTCQIGSVLSVDAGQLTLQEINPAAQWDKKPWQYSVRDITRIDFGGDYENALHLVGGHPAGGTGSKPNL